MTTKGIIPTKISQLSKYKEIGSSDFLLIVDSTIPTASRQTSFGELHKFVNENQTQFTGSFTGSFVNDNNIISGSISGSLQGAFFSTNTEATGAFSGSLFGNGILTNVKTTGSYSGSLYGSLISKNIKVSGSIDGNLKADKLISKYARLTNCQFSGSMEGDATIIDSTITGSFTGSFYGKLISTQMYATGTFGGNINGDIISEASTITDKTVTYYTNVFEADTFIVDKFVGPTRGRGSNGIFSGTGSFKGKNFTKVGGKDVSFDGTAPVAISASHAQYATRVITNNIKIYTVYEYIEFNTLADDYTNRVVELEKPSAATWLDYEITATNWWGEEDGISYNQTWFQLGDYTSDVGSTELGNDYYISQDPVKQIGNSSFNFNTDVDSDGTMGYWWNWGEVVDEMKSRPAGFPNKIYMTVRYREYSGPGSTGPDIKVAFKARYYYP